MLRLQSHGFCFPLISMKTGVRHIHCGVTQPCMCRAQEWIGRYLVEVSARSLMEGNYNKAFKIWFIIFNLLMLVFLSQHARKCCQAKYVIFCWCKVHPQLLLGMPSARVYIHMYMYILHWQFLILTDYCTDHTFIFFYILIKNWQSY